MGGDGDLWQAQLVAPRDGNGRAPPKVNIKISSEAATEFLSSFICHELQSTLRTPPTPPQFLARSHLRFRASNLASLLDPIAAKFSGRTSHLITFRLTASSS